MAVVIQGFPSTDKVPGAYGEVQYGTGSLSASDIPLKLLLVGLANGGTAAPDADVVEITSSQDAIDAFGSKSQLTRMCLAALQTSGVSIHAIAVANPDGGIAASCTFTVTGSWSGPGTYNFRLGGESHDITIAASDSPSDVASKIAAAIEANRTGIAVGTASSGVATATAANVGTSGNAFLAFHNTTQLPTGCSIALAGGASVTGGGVHFAGGIGTENVANVLTALFASQFDRIAIAQNDATNLARWKAQLNSQAAPVEGRRQHAIVAVNGSRSAAETLANTTLNAYRFQLLWQPNGETHPSEVAASFAAARTQKEQSDPAASYDDFVLPAVAPNAQRADWPSHAQLVAALNNGVTPILSTTTEARICRSIVTHCLNGTTPDYRTLDTSDAYVPDYVLTDLLLLWSSEFKIANPRVRDNPAPEEREPADGVAYPDLWSRKVEGRLRRFERGDGLAYPIVSDVESHKPIANFDASARRIMCAVEVVPAANQHQIGISVRQRAV